ncbi:31427_t:CDS:2 [Gigaspora margarita]|uniref:31427_t:CDS:1 n=1 Tax=Gigaspora margarita TaxID=4874 RepID=A0ABM8VWJ6_GIGMA|nr:31427_t:CDS:2 [Gigaspora margarita]
MAISAHIEKTIAKLKTQMERAKIEGEQSQVVPVENLKHKADSQRLCQKINTFLEDLRQPRLLIDKRTGQAAQLPYYFSLGALIEKKACKELIIYIEPLEAQAIAHQEIEEILELINLTGA